MASRQAGGPGSSCVAAGLRPWCGARPVSEPPRGRGMSASGQFLISILWGREPTLATALH